MGPQTDKASLESVVEQANELIAILVNCVVATESTVACFAELIEQALANPNEQTLGALKRTVKLYRAYRMDAVLSEM